MSIVLRHLVYDRLRRQRVAATNAAQRVAAATYAEDAVPWWCELDATAVRTELRHLSPPLRETFELFTFEARSYEDIARRLRVAESTVGVRISRARAALRQRLIARHALEATGVSLASRR
jgi:RNA polymerase sigma factor (sigma-70 family)